MKGLDGIVFTAGIGENSDVIRKLVCDELEFMGLRQMLQVGDVIMGYLLSKVALQKHS